MKTLVNAIMEIHNANPRLDIMDLDAILKEKYNLNILELLGEETETSVTLEGVNFKEINWNTWKEVLPEHLKIVTGDDEDTIINIWLHTHNGTTNGKTIRF